LFFFYEKKAIFPSKLKKKISTFFYVFLMQLLIILYATFALMECKICALSPKFLSVPYSLQQIFRTWTQKLSCCCTNSKFVSDDKDRNRSLEIVSAIPETYGHIVSPSILFILLRLFSRMLYPYSKRSHLPRIFLRV